MTNADATADGDGGTTATRVRRGLDYALLGGLALLGLIAAIQFYLAADQTINVWVTREYRPPFKMVFNLVVLLVVGIGLSRQVRRLTGTSSDADADDANGDAAGDAGTGSASATTASEPASTAEAGTPAAQERAAGDAAPTDASPDDDARS